MGKKNKGKKQEQETTEHKQSEEIQPEPVESIVNETENFDSGVLIQPNQNQKKIIEELLNEEEEERAQKIKEDAQKSQQQPQDLIQDSEVNKIEKQVDLIEVDDVNVIQTDQQQNEQKTITPSNNLENSQKQVEQSIQQVENNVEASNQQHQGIAEINLGDQQQQQQQLLQQQEEARYVVNIFDQARSGFLLPWAYAIDNELISPLEYDHEGYHLIHRAAIYNQLDIVHTLIQRFGVPVDLLEKNLCQTPLIFACLYGHFKLIKYLVDNGANVNAMDSNRFTPVINTVMNRYKLQTIYLMSKGADINVLDQDNCNLAHRAAFNNDVPMLQLLNQVARSHFSQQDKYKLAPVGRAITNDSHQAFKYLQRVHPIPVPAKNFDNLPNKCMANLINQEYKNQNIRFLSKEWLLSCYKSRPKDLCIFMYAIMIGTLYYHFVLQTGILYHKSTNYYYFCNVIHGLTVILMTYIFIFTLKSECPSHNLKLGIHSGAKNINFRKYDMSKVNFKYLDSIFGYNSKDPQSGEEIEHESDEGNQQKKQQKIHPTKRSRLNILDYIVILVENEKFQELNKLNDNNICYECLDIKEDRYHHSNRFELCVKNYSHFSEVFDKLIIKGTNDDKYYFIILIQWVLLVLFFIANYLYCSARQPFEGWTIFTFVEIPFKYYQNEEWKFLGIYLFACVLFYLASLYFFIETYGIFMNLTRYEIFNPNKCHYFYPNKNIQEINSSRSRYGGGEQASTHFKYYENPYSRCISHNVN